MGIDTWLDNWFTDLTAKRLAATLIIAWFILGVGMASLNIIFNEGYDITITGTINYHKLEHVNVLNYDYTDVQLITFRGKIFEIELLGHVDLDFGSTYRIVYTRKSPLGYHVWLYGEVISVTLVDIPERWAWYPP